MKILFEFLIHFTIMSQMAVNRPYILAKVNNYSVPGPAQRICAKERKKKKRQHL